MLLFVFLCTGGIVNGANPNIEFPADAQPKIPNQVIGKQNVTNVLQAIPGSVKELKTVTLKYQRDIIVASGTNQFSVVTNVDEPIVIDWKPSAVNIGRCQERGYSLERCQNHIMLAEETRKNTLLVCGTNADTPVCRYYNITQETFGRRYVKDITKNANDMVIHGMIPSDPKIKFETFFTPDKTLYTAVGGTTPLVKKWFMDRNGPNLGPLSTYPNAFPIIGSVEIISLINTESKMFVFFTETVDGNLVSRVATICANDPGSKDKSDRRFTTFVKTKIDCPVTKDASFRFDLHLLLLTD